MKENGREDIWRKLTNGLRALEAEHEDEIDVFCLRAKHETLLFLEQAKDIIDNPDFSSIIS